jgi:hypothetical protein
MLPIQINTPFILAPPRAARAFYASVSGARRLPAPNDQFYAFPCLNPPAVQFEFGGASASSSSSSGGGGGSSNDGSDGGMSSSSSSSSPSTRFTVLKAGDVRKHVIGGRFSLGRIRPGSGYCVGAVVETRMGAQEHGAAEAADAGDDDNINKNNSNAQRTKMAKRKDWRGATMSAATTAQRRLSMGSEAAGNGLDDVWILGEPFFRSVALVFDVSSGPPLSLIIIIERNLSLPQIFFFLVFGLRSPVFHPTFFLNPFFYSHPLPSFGQKDPLPRRR